MVLANPVMVVPAPVAQAHPVMVSVVSGSLVRVVRRIVGLVHVMVSVVSGNPVRVAHLTVGRHVMVTDVPAHEVAMVIAQRLAVMVSAMSVPNLLPSSFVPVNFVLFAKNTMTFRSMKTSHSKNLNEVLSTS
jgi:hydrogenase maturation factor